jgi:hypothetical protein
MGVEARDPGEEGHMTWSSYAVVAAGLAPLVMP